MIQRPTHTFRQANKLSEPRKKDPNLGAKENNGGKVQAKPLYIYSWDFFIIITNS